MKTIAIVGTSGVGKSFLVKQLSIAFSSPAFFEGEEGTFPEDLLENIFSGESPIERWRWFIERDKKILTLGKQIASLGTPCFLDNAVINSRAILSSEIKEYHEELNKMIEEIAHLEADIIILLKAEKEKLEELTKLRGRNLEQNREAIQRALSIQDEFIKLSNSENVIVIDRSNLDFSKNADLQEIIELVNERLKQF